MTEITSQAVKDLREKTGAGMMDCKKALTECGGDFEKAVDFLRAKGLATAAKKSSRVASQGLVGVVAAGGKAALVEVNSETDFVAKNELFQNFVRDFAAKFLASDGAEKTIDDAKTELTDLIAKIGENMNVRRATLIKGPVLGTYVHGAISDGLGKIAVATALSDGDEALAKQISMHIAAAKPICVNATDMPADVLEREKAIYAEQAKASGKPDNIVAKMVEGRVNRFYEESVLLEQPFVMDPDKKVKAILPVGVTVLSFASYVLGEGLSKKEDDFAAEVAAMAK